MQALNTLIDKAAKMCGSQSALAEKLHMSRQHISAMKKGERAITPALAVVLAFLADEDPREAMEIATLESAKDSPIEYMLGQVLRERVGVGSGLRGPLNINQMTREQLLENAKESTDELVSITDREQRRDR